ncbi:MAG: alpha/beta hydrolase [Deltaproteobacteria bacterium]|nr:alpha/beta hydrolase [Deltaproteobacteria bacterium]
MKLMKFSIVIDGQSNEIVANVRDTGKNLIFLVHGLGCSKDSFHHIWNRTDFDDYSILALDLAGFGESSKSKKFSYAMEAQARICAEILMKFSYMNLHIVAHSMGGAVALLLPDEILNGTKTVTNVEGNLIGADCGIISREIISVPLAMFESDIFPELRDKFNSFGEKYAAIDSTSADALYKSAESLVAWSDSNKLLEIFLRLPCRKAYFFGDENVDLPMVTHVGDVQKVKIKQSGHFPMNDNPKVFYCELYKFLNGDRQNVEQD